MTSGGHNENSCWTSQTLTSSFQCMLHGKLMECHRSSWYSVLDGANWSDARQMKWLLEHLTRRCASDDSGDSEDTSSR